MRNRAIVLSALLALLVAPLALLHPQPAAAASTMTIVTKERGSGKSIPHVCYGVRDMERGGDVAGGCDDDGDGTTVLTTDGAGCSNCRIGQSLRDDPNTGLPTEYLSEPFQFGGFNQTYTFENFLKPYLVVTARDARTGDRVAGACITVANVDQGGASFGGCDGGTTDEDGERNGKIATPRLTRAGNYRVDQKAPFPAGYVQGASVPVAAKPALPGEFENVTIELPPAPKIVIKTVDSQSGKRLPGACYAIPDKSHGGGLGTHCDGQLINGFGDQDGVKNGIIVTKPLPVGHTYGIDQVTAPRGYRLAKRDKEVTTVAGKDAVATIQNRRAG